MAVAAHREKFGTACLEPQAQTKASPADLAAVDFDVWLWQYAVAETRVWSDGGGRRSSKACSARRRTAAAIRR